MKPFTMLSLCWLLAGSWAIAQTSLKGRVNEYFAVRAVDACTGKLTVADPSPVLQPGALVILIQMKGAQARTDETNAFGTVTQVAEAGKYERNRIASVQGNEVVLEQALLNTYQPLGGVQLVLVPEYASASVDSQLTAPAWNGSTGGVLALSVSGTLTLKADIDLSGKGFRGGLSEIIEESRCGNVLQRNPTDYGVGRESWKGAPKGEGIADPGNKPNGRGAIANGGGGGNDHNSGGGGGANGGNGGNGGENRQSGFGCDGPNPGLGGRALTRVPDRIYMGGGGGGGHENNKVGTAGGTGGGIVFLLAGSIAVAGENLAIRANGQTPPMNSGDGAGGGGGGGSIVLIARQVSGTLLIQAGGGAGGTIDNATDPSRCMGPGGGGGGGQIWHSPSLAINTDVAGGAAGRSLNSTASNCTGTNGAQAGAPGSVNILDSLQNSGRPNLPPAITAQPAQLQLCLGKNGILRAETRGSNLIYQWQVDRNNSGAFTDLGADATFQGVKTKELTISNAGPALNGYRFRLRVSGPCTADLFSEVASLSLGEAPKAGFQFNQVGATVQFTNLATNAVTYSWSFGDGSSSEQPSPSHSYAGGGTYRVTMRVSNACGVDSVSQLITLALAPTAGFNASTTQGCAPLSVNFQSQSSLNTTTLQWSFPGGSPATSTQPNPVVQYALPGVYPVELIAVNAQGQDTLRRESYIMVESKPSAGFSSSVIDREVRFQPNTPGSGTYRWDFGDGERSTQPSPVHLYASAGSYEVMLRVENSCGSDSSRQLVQVGQPLIANFSSDRSNGCTPHRVQFTNTSSGGPQRLEWQFPGGDPASSTAENPVVLYSQPGAYSVVLTIWRDSFTNVVHRDSLIKVRDYPEVDFSFEQEEEEGQYSFINQSTGADRYTWKFGDGTTSNEPNPVHTYRQSGIYEVTLNAQNGSCASAASQTIAVLLTTGLDPLLLPPSLRLFPNPSSGIVNLTSEDPGMWPLSVQVFSAQGQWLRRQVLSGNQALQLSDLPAGLYLLHLRNRQGEWLARLSLVK